MTTMRTTSLGKYTVVRLKQAREDLYNLRKVVNVAELTSLDIISIDDTAYNLAGEMAVFLVWVNGVVDAGVAAGKVVREVG
jgi:hypothetical protein